MTKTVTQKKELPVIQAMVVVEGWADTQRLAMAVNCDTIETGGSALNQDTIERIRIAAGRRGVIVLTDPDFNGNRLRQLILSAVPTVVMASISRDQARAVRDNPHQSLGVEHANPSDLQAILLEADQKVGQEVSTSNIDQAFLLSLGLIGSGQARKRRRLVGDRLSVGYANGKQFLKRLRALGFQQDDLLQLLEGDQHGQDN